MQTEFLVKRQDVLAKLLFPIGGCLLVIGVFRLGADVGHVGRRVIFVALMLSAICIACLEVEPGGEADGDRGVGRGVVVAASLLR